MIGAYANISTKTAYQHPVKEFKLIESDKGKIKYDWDSYSAEESERTKTFTKRMNVPGASLTPYGKGKSGISQTIKFAIMKELTSPTYNFTGTSHTQDV
jgi:hypothetical protein